MMQHDLVDEFFKDPFMDPFSHMNMNQMAGHQIENGHHSSHGNRKGGSQEITPFGAMQNMFEQLNREMGSMHQMLSADFANLPKDGACHIESYSYVAENNGKNPPIVTEKHYSHTRNGDISQTQASLRDGRNHIDKMQLQRKLGDKSHTMTKQRINGGAIESNEHLENLNDGEVDSFHNQWKSQAKEKLQPMYKLGPHYHYNAIKNDISRGNSRDYDVTRTPQLSNTPYLPSQRMPSRDYHHQQPQHQHHHHHNSIRDSGTQVLNLEQGQTVPTTIPRPSSHSSHSTHSSHTSAYLH